MERDPSESQWKMDPRLVSNQRSFVLSKHRHITKRRHYWKVGNALIIANYCNGETWVIRSFFMAPSQQPDGTPRALLPLPFRHDAEEKEVYSKETT